MPPLASIPPSATARLRRIVAALEPQLDSLRRYGPCALLVSVALTQCYFARCHGLTPWKGGGFGMFSTVDAGPHRRLVVRFVADGIESEVKLRYSGVADLQDEATQVRNLPSANRLTAFARALAAQSWTRLDAASHEHVCDAAHDRRHCPIERAWESGVTWTGAAVEDGFESSNAAGLLGLPLARGDRAGFVWQPRLPGSASVGDRVVLERVDVEVARLSYDLRTGRARHHVVASVSIPVPQTDHAGNARRPDAP